MLEADSVAVAAVDPAAVGVGDRSWCTKNPGLPSTPAVMRQG